MKLEPEHETLVRKNKLYLIRNLHALTVTKYQIQTYFEHKWSERNRTVFLPLNITFWSNVCGLTLHCDNICAKEASQISHISNR